MHRAFLCGLHNVFIHANTALICGQVTILMPTVNHSCVKLPMPIKPRVQNPKIFPPGPFSSCCAGFSPIKWSSSVDGVQLSRNCTLGFCVHVRITQNAKCTLDITSYWSESNSLQYYSLCRVMCYYFCVTFTKITTLRHKTMWFHRLWLKQTQV